MWEKRNAYLVLVSFLPLWSQFGEHGMKDSEMNNLDIIFSVEL